MWIGGIKDKSYTGVKITHEYAVYDGTKRLTNKSDYTITYKNNLSGYELAYGENGFDAKKAPQVIVKGKGNYSGTYITYFKILKINLEEDNDKLVIEDFASVFTGKKITPKPHISWNGKKLTSKDYSIKEVDARQQFTAPGTYNLTIQGKGSFTGEKVINFTISNDKNDIPIDKVNVKYSKKVPFTGSEIQLPLESVTYKKEPLAENRDYTVRYQNNTAAGTASIILKAVEGSGFIGSKVITFAITGKSMNNIQINGLEGQGYVYTGKEICPLKQVMGEEGKKVTIVYKPDGSNMEEGVHFTVSYEKNVNRGVGTMVLTGIPEGGYTGTKKISFKIVSKSI